MTYATLG